MTDYLTLGPDGRVVDREGKTLELTRDLSSPAGPLRTIVAFANSAGGRLVVDVPLSTRRPHYLTQQGPETGVYVRLGSTTRQADPALVAELERNARGLAFEDLPGPHPLPALGLGPVRAPARPPRHRHLRPDRDPRPHATGRR
ncbi:AlbA family DNA-binding domain-containing protein [Actinomyces trachealis]|uniref:AlbA family DNA-binding domain-containing protein n=1 Tax=Actinomyces trachealis TaxID=2763540 RepID=UPI001FD1B26E|nr:ATP-binding protein [Actinomyces trachealis]